MSEQGTSRGCLSSGTQHMLQALLLLSSQILGFRVWRGVRGKHEVKLR